ncbi:MAG: response regulator [Fibrobacteria bacterium]|nr:response regulator [Fibrobacteria bacterium]
MATILLTGKDYIESKKFQLILEKENHNISLASNIKEAKILFKTVEPQLVLADATDLPERDVKILGTLTGAASQLFILTEDEEGLKKTLSEKNVTFFNKPVSNEKLLSSIKSVIAKLPESKPSPTSGVEKAIPKILIIEDSKTVQKLYEAFFRSSSKLKNIELIQARSAEEGFRKIKNNCIDLIILDWQLPKMSGIEFLSQLRASDTGKNIKVIMSTSVSDKENVIKAASLGITGYLVKPILSKRFIEAIVKEVVS